MNKHPVTAIVVSRNEAHRLDACLARLSWCDQLIVVDLTSSDDTVRVARRHTQQVLTYPFSPIVEPTRKLAAQHARHDWLLFVDPDEQLPEALVSEIIDITTNKPDAGIIRLPWLFHFRGQPMPGTIWGGSNRSKRFMAHRRRCEITGLSQAGLKLQPGFDEVSIAPRPGNHVRHDWVDSYAQLLEKHWRLGLHDGPAQFAAGQRFHPRTAARATWRAFVRSFVACDGWRMGVRGLLLSAVYAGFVALSNISLAIHQRTLSRESVRCEPVPMPAKLPARRRAA
jgi:glycosyltransferase involved in cell wall biosynthesis